MEWTNLLQGYSVINGSNFTTVQNGFTDGISVAKTYFQLILEQIDDVVHFVFSAFPSAFLLIILAVVLYAVVQGPAKKISKW